MEYTCARTLNEAAHLLASHKDEAMILAGGTDLLIQLSRKTSPEILLISLKNIEELSEIKQNKNGEIFIGALVSHFDITRSPVVNQAFPALAKASSLVGSPSTRNMATIGGNICNASPSADTAPPLLIYGAKALVWNPSGEKKVDIEDFFSGPSMNILKKEEILKGFLLKPRSGLISSYEKLGTRNAMEIAIVNVAVSMIIDDNKRCNHIRIALGAVAPTPIRAKKAEAILEDKKMTPSLMKESAQMAIKESKPISDIRASSDYRKKMIGYLVEKMTSDLAGLNSTTDISF